MTDKAPVKGLVDIKPKPKSEAKSGNKAWRFENVPVHEDGTRLDRFLRRLIPGLGQGQIEKMLRNGLIRLDGAKVKAATRLLTGQVVRLPPVIPETGLANPISAPRIVASASLHHQLDDMFLAEGKGWLALNKPSGLAVQGGSGTHQHIDGMLKAISDDSVSRLRLVHRIDKDTSGVLLLAKTIESARSLTEAFQKHWLEKTYLGLVVGLPPETGSIREPILKFGGKTRDKMRVHKNGQSAQTLYRRLDHTGREAALMALRPLTGRTHQLRVHMAYLGNPICGDGKYGGENVQLGGLIARRLHLHAWQLKLANGKAITAPISPHMKASLDDLGMAVPSDGWRFPNL